jgi:biopolymer transport protein ExbB
LLTVVSMIETFSAIGIAVEAGEQGAAGKSSGKIGLALFATAMGLITAIPLVFTHVMYKAGIHKFELQMKSAGQKLSTLVQNYKDNPQPSAPAGGAAVAVAVPGGAPPKGKPPEPAVAAKRV